MLLDGSIPEDEFQKAKAYKEFNISNSEINEVKNFVINNSYALDKVADQLIYEDEFDEVFIHGGNPASEEAKNKLKTEEDQNRNVEFNDFAFHMLLSTATYLRNLAMMHSDFINYKYKSPDKSLNLEALKSAVDACKESLSKNETEIRPFSIYQTRADLLKFLHLKPVKILC